MVFCCCSFFLQAFLSENFNTVTEGIESVKNEISNQCGPADTLLLGRVGDFSSRLTQVEESERRNELKLEKIDVKIDALTGLVKSLTDATVGHV